MDRSSVLVSRRVANTPVLALAVGLGLLAVVVLAVALLRDSSAASGGDHDSLLAAMNADPAKAAALPRIELQFSHAAPAASLEEALAKATLAVRGEVQRVEFRKADPGVETLVTLKVAESLKGDAKDIVTVVQPGGPVIYFDEHGDRTPQLLEFPGDTILFPGDEVVLFLVPNPNHAGAHWSAWPYTSQYRISGGAVTALDGNPFAADIAGMSPADLVARVTLAAK